MTDEKFPMITVDDISEVELFLGIEFPSDYKEFLLNHNGAIFRNYPEIKISDLKSFLTLDILCGIKTNMENCNILDWTVEYRDEMDKYMIIVGNSAENGFFVLDCDKENPGMYYWDDTRHFEESTDDSNTYFISRTFSEFLSLAEF